MQGAAMNETNTANYGTITTIGGAGQYELNVIDSVLGSTIYLKYYFKNNYSINGNVHNTAISEH
jgi:hypothetical protein